MIPLPDIQTRKRNAVLMGGFAIFFVLSVAGVAIAIKKFRGFQTDGDQPPIEIYSRIEPTHHDTQIEETSKSPDPTHGKLENGAEENRVISKEVATPPNTIHNDQINQNQTQSSGSQSDNVELIRDPQPTLALESPKTEPKPSAEACPSFLRQNSNMIIFNASDNDGAAKTLRDYFLKLTPSATVVATNEWTGKWKMEVTRIYYIHPEYLDEAKQLAAKLHGLPEVVDYERQLTSPIAYPEKPGPIFSRMGNIEKSRHLAIFLGQDYSVLLKSLADTQKDGRTTISPASDTNEQTEGRTVDPPIPPIWKGNPLIGTPRPFSDANVAGTIWDFAPRLLTERAFRLDLITSKTFSATITSLPDTRNQTIAIKKHLAAQGILLTIEEQAENPPRYLALRSTVFYYTNHTQSKAEALASELSAITKARFIASRGATPPTGPQFRFAIHCVNKAGQ